MGSPQALNDRDRRLVAGWAADCAERVLGLFEAEAPADDRPRDAIARARAYSRGELSAAEEIRRRFVAGRAASAVGAPAAIAAARSAAQASGVAHVGAHALGAAAYAAEAAGLAAEGDEGDAATEREIRWQVARMTPEVRSALALLPLLGQDSSGPLASGGLLDRGLRGAVIRALQAVVHDEA
ncbi:putative immunity protein [Microbacterium panaciterrae]|uniref:Imm-5-like domain-containing protein n=1 Tax=Microbacterium panaciterrae TaxID=985759 RepID=A0ABP8P0T0_9MICO